MRIAWLILILVQLCPAPVGAAEAVDVELILMVDGSGSVDGTEYEVQRSGYAQALRDPRVLDAIRSGFRGRIALSYVEWSGASLRHVIVPWTLVQTAEDLEAFATALDNRPRMLWGGGTAIGNAIKHGANSIEANEFDGRRRVIDVSGDGPDKNGLPARYGRDYAVEMGMTVNGLPIMETYGGLDVFYQDNVIGGPGAFSIPARGFKDVGIAVRKKLILEIAGTMPGHAGIRMGEGSWISPRSTSSP